MWGVLESLLDRNSLWVVLCTRLCFHHVFVFVVILCNDKPDVEVVNADKTPSELQVRCGMTLYGVLFLTMGPRILCRDMVTFFHQNMASQEKNLKRTILIKHSCPSVSLLSRRTIFKE